MILKFTRGFGVYGQDVGIQIRQTPQIVVVSALVTGPAVCIRSELFIVQAVENLDGRLRELLIVGRNVSDEAQFSNQSAHVGVALSLLPVVGVILLSGIEVGSTPLLTNGDVTHTGGTGGAGEGWQIVVEDEAHTGHTAFSFRQLIDDVGIAAVPGSGNTESAVVAAVLHHDGVIFAGDGHTQRTGLRQISQFVQAAACGGADTVFDFIVAGGFDVDFALFVVHDLGTAHVSQRDGGRKHECENQDQTQQFLQNRSLLL